MGYEPVEMHTAATEKLQNALSTYAGVTGDPTEAEYHGYLSVDALVQGLKAAGSNATQASFINAMLAMTSYQGQGLWGGHSISWAMADRGQVSGADNCEWITQYSGYYLPCGLWPESHMRTDHPGQEDLVTAAAIFIASPHESTIG